MKKLHPDHRETGDDKELIDLLKTSLSREPSEEFVDITLKKFYAFKEKARIVHRPLKFPLYLMSILSLFLLSPIILTFVPWTSFSRILDLDGYFAGISMQIDAWYIISPLLLFPAVVFLLWMELENRKHKSTLVR